MRKRAGEKQLILNKIFNTLSFGWAEIHAYDNVIMHIFIKEEKKTVSMHIGLVKANRFMYWCVPFKC